MNNKRQEVMGDITGIIVVTIVFRTLWIVLKAVIGGEWRNDFRRDR